MIALLISRFSHKVALYQAGVQDLIWENRRELKLILVCPLFVTESNDEIGQMLRKWLSSFNYGPSSPHRPRSGHLSYRNTSCNVLGLFPSLAFASRSSIGRSWCCLPTYCSANWLKQRNKICTVIIITIITNANRYFPLVSYQYCICENRDERHYKSKEGANWMGVSLVRHEINYYFY